MNHSPRPSLSSRFYIPLIFFFISLILSLILLEVVLRLRSPANTFNTTFAMYPHTRRILRVTKQGQTRVIKQTTNRWGMRGEEPPADWNNVYTIITIGDSTTQCYYLDDQDTWPHILQERLRLITPKVWVGNAGLDGHTTRGHLEVMKKVISAIRPRAVVVLTGMADAAMALHPASFIYDDPGRWTWRLYNKSRIAQLLYTWYLILGKGILREGRSPLSYTPLPLNAPSIEPTKKELDVPLQAYAKRLREMIGLARSFSVDMTFLTYPVLWEDTPYWRERQGNFYSVNDPAKLYSAATCAKVLKMYNQTLMHVCRQEHVDCFDLASTIPHRDAYFYDMAHLNEKGAALVAERVADYMKGKLPKS